MRYEKYALEVKQATAIGAPQIVRTLVNKTVQVSGTFSATINLEGSLDGVAWSVIASGLAPGFTLVAHSVRELRCNTTGYVSGTPVVVVAGMMADD